jgi:hypothetical protein
MKIVRGVKVYTLDSRERKDRILSRMIAIGYTPMWEGSRYYYKEGKPTITFSTIDDKILMLV